MDLSSINIPIPDGLGDAFLDTLQKIPPEFREAVRHASRYIPTEIDFSDAVLFIIYFAVASLIMSVLGRIALGKRSSLNHSLSSVMGILLVYVVTVLIYTFRPWNLADFLSPLPFVSFSGEYLIVLPITDTVFPTLCSEILSLIILSFLVNLLDSFIPQGDHLISWYLLRFISVGLSMVVHFMVRWAFQTYAPSLLVTYAPTALLVLLALFLFSGLLSLGLGLFIAVTNPFLGAMYAFFFSNVIGKQLSKAIFASVIICGIAFLLEYFGYTVICITSTALAAYIPLVPLFLGLWYLIGRIL